METLQGNPVSSLVRDVLLQEKQSSLSFNTKDNQYTLQWAQDNVKNLYVVSVASKKFPVPYASVLLEKIRSRFISMYPACADVDDYDEFTPIFDRLYQKIRTEHLERPNNQPKTFAETAKGKKLGVKAKPVKAVENEESKVIDTEEEISATTPAVIKPNLKGRGVRRGARVQQKGPKGKSKASSEPKTPKLKTKRVWDDVRGPSNTVDDPELNFSANTTPTVPRCTKPMEPVTETKIEYESSEEEEDDTPVNSGFFGKYLSSLTGKTLTANQLEPIMEDFKNHLTEKNVTSEIAENLCDNVAKTLMGTKLSTFGSAKTVVNDAMRDSLTKILTPKKEHDIMRDIRATNAKGKPYSIVFVGVNGVGKSTSLSKICSWLQQNGLKVLIAACDTFRSGAVEQLAIHCDRLGVPLFEQGYGKDASHIAAAAIKKAANDRMDVVLVDTAGRMQDNEPLMKALSTLVHFNSPDLVLFVGEALVGNDGVHQLKNFNRSLELLSTKSSLASQKDTIIDGVVLTKFDTIDDKVGAAVSMVYSTGIPIMFVGVGQHYHDLKKLNVNVVVKALLK